MLKIGNLLKLTRSIDADITPKMDDYDAEKLRLNSNETVLICDYYNNTFHSGFMWGYTKFGFLLVDCKDGIVSIDNESDCVSLVC